MAVKSSTAILEKRTLPIATFGFQGFQGFQMLLRIKVHGLPAFFSGTNGGFKLYQAAFVLFQ